MKNELFFLISGIINTITHILLGFFIFFKDSKNKANKSFFILCLAVVGYSLPYIFWTQAADKETALLIFQIISISPFYIPVIYLHFLTRWLNLYNKYKKFIFIGYGLATLFLFFVFTPLFIKDMVPKYSMKFWAVPGIAFHFHLIIFFIYAVFALYILFKSYRVSTKIKKAQLKLIISGTILGYLGGITNYFLWYDINIPPYGVILISVWTIFVAYAIIAYQWMDIKLALRQSSVYLASLATVIFILISVRHIFSLFNFPSWFDLIILIIVLAVFQLIKKYYYYLANKYFFSSLYDAQEIVASLSDKLRSTLEAGRIYNNIYTALSKSFHVKCFAVLLYDNKVGNYIFQYKKYINSGRQSSIIIPAKLNRKYIAKNQPILRDELKNEEIGEDNEMEKIFRNLGIEVIIPIKTNNKVIGIIALGPKESNDIYSRKDLQTLKIVSGLASGVIENANLYKDIKKKNQRLEELLSMKSDFLRVVNHQLNTPLSIMRYAISSAEENQESFKENIKIANEGLKRISSTLDDFWNAYQLEGEKLKLKLVTVNIEKIIAELVEEKKKLELFKKRSLELKISYPEFKIPNVVCDYNKIIYVISNLLDNAVFYTNKGGVIISFDKIKQDGEKYLKILITDTGVGIDPKDRKNLFKKFTRGQRASLLHPDGSGLGLYIAKKIVKECGGELKLEKTELGKGTNISFTLPILL